MNISQEEIDQANRTEKLAQKVKMLKNEVKVYKTSSKALEAKLQQRDAIIQRYDDLYNAGALCIGCLVPIKALEGNLSECLECEIYELANVIKGMEVKP